MAATDSNRIYFDEFHRYHSDEMSRHEQNQFEKRLMDDHLFADAYEGYLSMMGDRVDGQSVLGSLNQQLESRVTERRQRLIPVWAYATAAAVILSVSWLLYTTKERADITNVATDKIASPEAKPSESAPDNTIAAIKSLPDSLADSVEAGKPESLLSKPGKVNSGTPVTIYNKSERIAANEAVSEITVPDLGLSDVSPSQIQSVTKDENAPRLASRPAASPAFSTPGVSKSGGDAANSKRANYHNVVQGRIVDADGQGLPGVNVLRSGNGGVETDNNGNFRIEIAHPDSLKIAYIGYKTKLVPVDKSNLGDIKLEEDRQALSEVVVIDYGRAKSKRSSGLFKKADVQPRPSVGWESYHLYLTQKGATAGYGVVKVQFKVNDDGALSDFSAKGDTALHEQAFALIKNGSTWIPAEKNNVKVAAFVTVTAVFEK